MDNENATKITNPGRIEPALILEATKVFKWEGAHQLKDSHDEGCQRIHGHSYKMEVTVCSTEGVNEMGMVVDFKILKEIVEPIIKQFDHTFITAESFGSNPTAENMALYVMSEVGQALKVFSGLYCSKIRIWETDNCNVTVRYPKELPSNVYL